jgi:hypothetical protein
MVADMQAKDISDEAFLAAVQGATRGPWATRWDVTAALEAPEKVVLAKARKLIRRGLLDGCACGCRGDFQVPAQG